MSLNRKHVMRYGAIALLLAVVAVSVVTLESRYREQRVVEQAQRLQLLAALRKEALQTYFSTAKAEIGFWSVTARMTDAMTALQAGWQALGEAPGERVRELYVDAAVAGATTPANALDNAGDGSAYSEAHASLQELARGFIRERGYYDLFLIDMQGNVIFSVEKESDFGSNLFSGPLKESGLARMARLIIDSYEAGGEQARGVHGSDFSRYEPSDNLPAIFGGQLMFDAANQPLGIFALQLPTDAVDKILRFTAGMGETGETYAVGEDLLMRSDSRFSETPTTLSVSVESDTVKQALAGNTGVAFGTDYRGVEVLSAYDHLDFRHTRWAIMAEMDAAEVRRNAGSILGMLLAFAAALLALVAATVGALRGMRLGDSTETATTYDLDAG